MHVRRLLTSLFAIALALPGVAAAQSNIAGDWDLTITSPRGANTVKMAVKQDGAAITGAITSPMGEVPVKGSVAGDTATLIWAIDAQGMQLQITMTGKVQGDAIEGSAKFGDFGEGPFTAKRAAAGSAAAKPAEAAPAPAAAASAATAGSAAGEWELSFTTPQGAMNAAAILTQTGETVTGTLRGPQGDIAVQGTQKGKELSLTMSLPQVGDAKMTGQINGDDINEGSLALGAMGAMPFTGKRTKK